MKSICVFCGSNPGNQSIFSEQAIALGQVLVKKNIKLIYGAGNVGLMGVIADAMLKENGEVVGVIPHFLMAKEVGHTGLSELIEVETMHQRKQIMADLSEGFIAMPGGFGTMDEVCEILTWAQLGLHAHPIGLLDVEGYYQPLIQLFDNMVAKGFLHPKNRELVLMHEDPEKLLELMDDFEAPDVEKWLDRAQV
ncbi:UNVERIFIED_CONTAM: hypothetical protein GTU68_050861 [Idotea baltica]|nr:hypothetical protein [Idotea baltica]